MKRFPIILLLISVIGLGACTEIELAAQLAKNIPPPPPSQGTFKVGSPYKISGKRYYPQETYNHTETGIASWYGPNFHGKPTANGEIFDQYELTAAHRTLQLPSLVRVTNLENGRSLIVRVNDRGPFSKGRIIDLSKRSAELLGVIAKGTAKVKVELLPEESKAIALAAKRGEDTSGIEIAMNENRFAKPKPVSFQLANAPVPKAAPNRYNPPAPSGKPKVSPVKNVNTLPRQDIASASMTNEISGQTIPGHVRDGNFMPDPVVQEVPVSPTSIFVQAGAFSKAVNAQSHAQTLSRFGNTQVFEADVQGKSFYRVRLGPLNTVNEADTLLEQLAQAGQNDAIIVVVD